MSDVTPLTRKYISRLKNFYASPAEQQGVKIHADEISRHLASFFEKIRNIVDYQEEHLLIKRAIERIIKRRFFFSLNKDGLELSESLILELIRSGYLPNDAIGEEKIQETAFVLNRYISVLEEVKLLPRDKRKEMTNWIFSLASCELEDRLVITKPEKLLVEYMYETMREKLALSDEEPMRTEEKNMVILFCVQKSLLKSDNVLTAYEIFKRKNPNWFALDLPVAPDDLFRQLHSLRNFFDAIADDPLTARITQVCQKHTATFSILGEFFQNHFGDVETMLDNPENLEREIRTIYEDRYKKLSARLKRNGFRMVLSIFLSKILVAFLIEIPYDLYTSHKLIPHVLGISIMAPPFLMYVIVSSIRPPSENNVNEIIMETVGVIYNHKDKYAVQIYPRRNLATEIFFRFLYGSLFIIIFGGSVWALTQLNFSIVATGIFLAFVCLITFSGAKIRRLARELEVGKERDNVVTFLLDNLSVPMIKVGKWLSGEFAKINILVILFNFFLEIPIQSILEFIAAWRGFVDEKKREIQ